MNGTVVLVTWIGEASGSKAAAAALACAGSEPDLPGLLVDVGGRPPRPTLVASTGARGLEERLAVHMPETRAASRGQTCHLTLPAGEEGLERLPAALPLVRESIAVVHLPPALLQPTLAEPRIEATGALLRADLASDRPLTGLAVRDLLERGLRVAVLKRPLAWVPARRALFGVLPTPTHGGLPKYCAKCLVVNKHECYGGSDDSETDSARTAQQEW
ncbi:MAG TPA: hypothetical protein VNO20_09115 [Solirubrobacterales bacterium]|nr:hypothetical protein [Solirubrobacterales bacterium]